MPTDFNLAANERQGEIELQDAQKFSASLQQGTAHSELIANPFGDKPAPTDGKPFIDGFGQTIAATPDDDKIQKSQDELITAVTGKAPDSPLKTFGKGLREMVTAPIHGGISAINEMAKTADWLVTPDLFDPATGDKIPQTQVPQLPNISDPETIAGKVSSGIMQFVTGFNAIGNITKLGGGLLPSLVKGAMTEATAFDAHTDNLANLIQSFPKLQNPITEYMQSDPDDSIAVGKLKNALVNSVGALGVEAAFQAIKGTYKYFRAFKTDTDAVAAQQTQAAQDVKQLKTMKQEDQLKVTLGQVDKPAFTFYDPKAAQVEDMAQAAKEVGKIGEVAPAPGYAYKDHWSADHAAEGSEAPKILEPVTITPELNRATPISVNGKTYQASFDTAEDKLAFTATSPTYNKTRVDAAHDLMQKAGWSDEQIDKMGAAVRENITQKAGTVTGNTIKSDIQSRNLFVDQASDALGTPTDLAGTALAKVSYGDGSRGMYNFAAIQNREGLTSTIRQMEDAFQKNPTAKPWASLSTQDVDAFDKVLNAPRGELINDAENIAVKQLLYASHLKLAELADMTMMDPSNNATRFAFAQQLDTHRLIANYYQSQGTEIARSLAARRKFIDPTQGVNINQRLREIDRALGTVDGANNLEYLAQAVSSAMRTGGEAPILTINKMIKSDGWMKTSNDLFKETWTNGLLSSVSSIATNFLSGAAVTANQIFERGMMEGMARATGDTSGVVPGQMAQWLYGQFTAIPDAISHAADAFAEGGKGRAWGSTFARTSVDDALPKGAAQFKATGANLLPNFPADSWQAQGMDFLGGVVCNWGTRAHIASDEFWTTLFYRGELRGQAYNQATKEGLTGDALDARIKGLMADPSDAASQYAIDSAHELRFTEQTGKFTRAVKNLRDQIPGGFMLLPFVNVPSNIMKYTYERTPLRLLQSEVRQTIADGGQAGQAEIAKMAAGTLMMTGAFDAYQRGYLTGRGSTDPREAATLARQGVTPYSVRVGDTWYKYDRLEPLGHLFGMLADIGDTVSYITDQDERHYKDFLSTSGAVALAIANSTLSKTYFQGVSNFIMAVGDHNRYGDKFLNQYAATFMPNSGIVGSYNKLMGNNDTDAENGDVAVIKSVRGIIDAWQARVPGLGDGLPPRRDLWGREMTVSRGTSQTWNALMPIEMSVHNPEPIDAELVKNKMFFGMPSRKFVFGDKEVNMTNNPAAYSRYVQLQGNEIKDPVYGMGMKDLLNDIVSGKNALSPYYQDASAVGGNDSQKAQIIRSIMNSYRTQAQAQIATEFSELGKTSKSLIGRSGGVPIQ